MTIATMFTLPGSVVGCTSRHLVSREPEITEIKRLLTTSRLLKLMGMGGSGKTYLACLATANLSK